MKKCDPDDYVKNRLKPPKAFFDWTDRSFPTYIWRNKDQVIKGSNRKQSYVHEKRLFKNSRLTFFDRKDYFEIVLSTSKRIELQTYEVASFFDHGKQVFEHRIVNLEIFSNDQHIKIGYENDEHFKFGLFPISTMFNRRIADVYNNDWEKRLSTISELRFIRLGDVWPGSLAVIYKYRNQIEFAQKIHADRLADDIVRHRIDMRIITKKWLQENKPFLRNSTNSVNQVLLKLAIERRGGKLVPGIQHYLNYDDVKKLPTKIGIVKMQNYLIKQGRNGRYYRDYLDLLSDLELPFNKSNLLPKNLQESHDKLVEARNELKHEILNKTFNERSKSLTRFEMVIGDYAFIVPKTANELIQEGNRLHHCVGGSFYIDGHANGELTIMFIRDKNATNQSLFTMEYRNHQIVQVQGMRNSVEQPPALKEAVSEWLQIANKTKNKKRQVVAA